MSSPAAGGILFIPATDELSYPELIFHEAFRAEGLPFHVRTATRSLREVDESFIADLLSLEPGIVAFSVFFWNLDDSLRLASAVRHLLPGAIILFGGPQIGLRADALRLLSDHREVDACICGEADTAFPAFARALSHAGHRDGHAEPEARAAAIAALSSLPPLEGLVLGPGSAGDSPEDGTASAKPACIADLGAVPLVYHDGNDLLARRVPGSGILPLQTLRGCRRSCGFCLYRGPLRLFPIERVAAELTWLCERGIPRVRLCDSHFGGSRERALEVFALIARRNRGTEFSFYPDPTHIDGPYLDAARKAGCLPISLGIESADGEVARRLGRGFPRREFARAAAAMAAAGMPLRVDLVLGLPGQGVGSFIADIAFAKSLGAAGILASPLMSLPGAWAGREAELRLSLLPVPQGFAYDSSIGAAGYARLLAAARAARILDLLPRAAGRAAALASPPPGAEPAADEASPIRRIGTEAFWRSAVLAFAEAADLDELAAELGGRSEAERCRALAGALPAPRDSAATAARVAALLEAALAESAGAERIPAPGAAKDYRPTLAELALRDIDALSRARSKRPR